MQPSKTKRTVPALWSSRTMFVLASAGAVIGFNNFWEFPALALQHGGGAFLIVYVFWLLVLALPLLTAQLMLARLSRTAPADAFRHAATVAKTTRWWWIVGALAVLGGFLIFCGLSVIAGWTMAFVQRAATGELADLTADAVSSKFSQLVGESERQLFWCSVFVAASATVCGRGLRAGIEPVIRYCVPVMFSLMFVLLLYAATTSGFPRAVSDVFMPDFDRLTFDGVTAAASHAFFTLVLGAGAIFAYGAYLDKDAPVMRLAWYVIALDVIAGVVGALTVYAVLYAGEVPGKDGPLLLFEALPLAFDHLMWGRVYLTAFFVMLVLAALLFGIALLEPLVMWLSERFPSWTRARAALVTAICAWVVSVVCVLSFSAWQFSFRFFGELRIYGAFDVIMIAANQVLLPLVGIGTALFAGWWFKAELSREQLNLRSPCAFDAWLWSIRIVIPLVLFWIMLQLSSPGL